MNTIVAHYQFLAAGLPQSASALLWSYQDLVRLRLIRAAVVESWTQTLYLPVVMQLLLKAGVIAGDCSLSQAICFGSCYAQSSSHVHSLRPFKLIHVASVWGNHECCKNTKNGCRLYLSCCFKLVHVQLPLVFRTYTEPDVADTL